MGTRGFDKAVVDTGRLRHGVFVLLALGASWCLAEPSPNVPARKPFEPPTAVAARLRQWTDAAYKADVERSRGRPALWARKGVLANREERWVDLYAVASGIAGQAPVEFFLSRGRAKDHETLAMTQAAPADLHAALRFIGMPPGRAVNDAKHHFWPKGERLDLAVYLADDATDAASIEAGLSIAKFIADARTREALPDDGFVFVGSFSDDGQVYLPEASGFIATTYNDGRTVLDLPRRSRQSEAYGRFVANPKRQLAPGIRLRIRITPRATPLRPRLRDYVLAIGPGTDRPGRNVVFELRPRQEPPRKSITSRVGSAGWADLGSAGGRRYPQRSRSRIRSWEMPARRANPRAPSLLHHPAPSPAEMLPPRIASSPNNRTISPQNDPARGRDTFSRRLRQGDRPLATGSFSAVLAYLAADVKRGLEPYVAIRFMDDLRVATVTRCAGLLRALSAEDRLRIEPTEGDLYFEAFLPQAQWRDGRGLLVSPINLQLAVDGGGTVVGGAVEADLGPLGRVRHACSTAGACARKVGETLALAKAAGHRTPPLFVHISGSATYGALTAVLKPVLDSIPLVYVFCLGPRPNSVGLAAGDHHFAGDRDGRVRRR